jgi:hypothetical protein
MPAAVTTQEVQIIIDDDDLLINGIVYYDSATDATAITAVPGSFNKNLITFIETTPSPPNIGSTFDISFYFTIPVNTIEDTASPTNSLFLKIPHDIALNHYVDLELDCSLTVSGTDYIDTCKFVHPNILGFTYNADSLTSDECVLTITGMLSPTLLPADINQPPKFEIIVTTSDTTTTLLAQSQNILPNPFNFVKDSAKRYL